MLFIYLAVLSLRFCARAFSSCGKRGPLFITVRGPLTIAASLVAEHRLQTRRLSSCGSRAQLLRGMWDLPRAGLEPVSPALAGRFSTTAPPGKPLSYFALHVTYILYKDVVHMHILNYSWILAKVLLLCMQVFNVNKFHCFMNLILFLTFSLCTIFLRYTI